MSEEDGTIEFLASIVTKAGAFSIDGEERAGGILRLAFSGTEIAPVLHLLKLRGRLLHITVAPQQGELPLGEGEIPAGDGKSEALFPETPATVSPSGLTETANPDREAEEAFNKPRARRVSRNLIPKTKKVKR